LTHLEKSVLASRSVPGWTCTEPGCDLRTRWTSEAAEHNLDTGHALTECKPWPSPARRTHQHRTHPWRRRADGLVEVLAGDPPTPRYWLAESVKAVQRYRRARAEPSETLARD
jgi:hypothetical protein